MEHRLRARIPTNLNVVLRPPGRLWTRCRTRDLSVDGLFVEVDAHSLGIRTSQTLTLELELPCEGGSRCVRARAQVVHRDAAGVGLMFTGLDASLADALQELVSDCHPGWHQAPLATVGDRH